MSGMLGLTSYLEDQGGPENVHLHRGHACRHCCWNASRDLHWSCPLEPRRQVETHQKRIRISDSEAFSSSRIFCLGKLILELAYSSWMAGAFFEPQHTSRCRGVE